MGRLNRIIIGPREITERLGILSSFKVISQSKKSFRLMFPLGTVNDTEFCATTFPFAGRNLY